MILRDLVYAAPGGRPLHADLFLPDVATEPSPVVVWLHGGGWRFGDRRVAPDCAAVFAAHGFAAVAIDYRLTTRATFPAQIEDVKTAVRWLRSIASTYAIDADRIAFVGSSAGGHLAALSALSGPGVFEPPGSLYAEHSSAVRAVVCAYAPIDFLQIDAHRPPDGTISDDAETLLLPRGLTRSSSPHSFESRLLGGPIEAHPDRVRAANPIAYMRRGAPPFLVLHGTSDTTVPPHQSELLFASLAAHGNAAALWLIEGLGHGFLHRPHLDEGPVRRRVERSCVPGRGTVTSEAATPIFAAIRTFLGEALGKAGTSIERANADPR